jgi:surface polysaccharide O-acyltransferase-like enzyme
MGKTSKKRIFYFDELRALAILLVVLCHVVILYRPFTYDNSVAAIPGFLYILTHVAVPIFFMLSGALLLNRNYTLTDFYKKRFTRIILPFILWGGVACIGSYFVLGSDFTEVYKIITGKERWTWFVWTMIGMYLILPVVNSFIKEYKLQGAFYFILIWFVTILLQTFQKYPFHRLELGYFSGYMGYMVLGYYLANKEFKHDWIMIILGAILFVLSIGADYYLVANDVSTIETKYLSLFVALAAIGLFLVFKHFAHYCDTHSNSVLGKIHSAIENGRLGSVILSLSVCSYGMYLLNNFVLRFFKPFTTFEYMPLIFIATVIICWALVKLTSKIPILDKFSGAG